MKPLSTQEIADILAGVSVDSKIELGDLSEALGSTDLHFTSTNKPRHRQKDLHIDIERYRKSTLIQTAESVKQIFTVHAAVLTLQQELQRNKIILLDMLPNIATLESHEGFERWLSLSQQRIGGNE